MQLLPQHVVVAVTGRVQQAREVIVATHQQAIVVAQREVRVVVEMRQRIRAERIVISTVASLETAMGRLDSVCGHTGTSAITRTDGCRIGPPDESAYAVEPVGEATMMPSERSV